MGIFLDGSFLDGNCLVGIIHMAIFPGGSFPSTIHNNKCNKFGKIPKVPDN